MKNSDYNKNEKSVFFTIAETPAHRYIVYGPGFDPRQELDRLPNLHPAYYTEILTQFVGKCLPYREVEHRPDVRVLYIVYSDYSVEKVSP